MKKNNYKSDILNNNKVHCEIWAPTNKPRFAMLLVHGLGEHCNRYDGDFANFFTDHGVIIYTFDLPGHGQSEGNRGHLQNHEDINRIIDEQLSQIKADHPDIPVFLYGHSLGGLISGAYVLEKQPSIHGVILSAPAFDVENPLPPFKVLLAKLMDKIYPSIALDNGLDREKLSKDESVVAEYNSDPLVHGLASARLGAFIINKGKFVIENPHLLSLPTLIMVGSDEAIVSKAAIHSFCESSTNCTEKVWDDMYHEIHNEPGKMSVFNYTLNWMEKTV